MKTKLPLIIAHRGASAEAPENTIAAFRRAIELGADGVELDVLLTRDRVPIVTHNNDLSILTGSKGLVSQVPFSTITKLDCHGEKIPTLEETLAFLCPHPITILIEIKFQKGLIGDVVTRVGDLLHNVTPKGSITVASFSIPTLEAMRTCHPQCTRAVISHRGPLARARANAFARQVDAHLIMAPLSPALATTCRDAHRSGSQFFVWTVNQPQQVDLAVDLGADGIITNDVAMVKKHLS